MSSHDRFFRRLFDLCSAEKIALRSASLRRGVRDAAAFEAFKRAHRQGRPAASRIACYIAALLFVWHPRTGSGLTLGEGLRWLPPSEAERMLRALLLASEETLQERLLAIVRVMARRGVPLGWGTVLDDLSEWFTDPSTVRARWASAWNHKEQCT